MKFTEEKLEKAFTELLGQERFSHTSTLVLQISPTKIGFFPNCYRRKLKLKYYE